MQHETQPEKGTSGPIYQSFVLSIFSDYRLLLIGVPASSAAVVLTAYVSNLLTLYFVAAAMALIGTARYFLTAAFHKEQGRRELSLRDYKIWENRYTVSAIVHALTFGVWCMVSVLADNPIAELASFAVTFGNLIGVCGRCFPIIRLVNGQLLAIGIPMMGALFYRGGTYAILAALLAPYMIGLRSIAARQRENLINNVVHRRRAERLAFQINNALENVPQGICMFDADGQLEVANRHIGNVIGRSDQSVRGMSILNFIDLLNADFGLNDQRADEVREWVQKSTETSIAFFFEMGDEDNHTIKFRASRMANGGVIATFEDITKEVQAASQIDHMQRFDRLTGLMNRNQLPGHVDERMSKLRKTHGCAVLLVNIDRFKLINDTLGHSRGDLLLCEVAQRLTRIAKSSATCARYSGDEFALVLTSKNALDEAASLADLICDSFSKPFEVVGRDVTLSCSIGIATNQSRDDSSEQLLQHADLALISAKKNGGADWRVYNAEMSREMMARQKLENELRLAMADQQFEAHFQPIVNVKDKRVSVCEALLRWNHPVQGYIPPGIFVPIAEEMGLITDIGSWMLFEACGACAKWPDDTRVAVNLSPLQFKNGDLLKTVKDALANSGLKPDRLELEITESLMLDDINETVHLLNEFKNMGVRISLDDFGTGYSSLNYLNELPLDKVKIDRSFVMDLHENAKSLTLVQAVTALGQKLGLSVVVEGIETPDQMKLLLKNAPIDEIQGYLFSKPVDKDTIGPLLNRGELANRSMMAKLHKNSAAAA